MSALSSPAGSAFGGSAHPRTTTTLLSLAPHIYLMGRQPQSLFLDEFAFFYRFTTCADNTFAKPVAKEIVPRHGSSLSVIFPALVRHSHLVISEGTLPGRRFHYLSRHAVITYVEGGLLMLWHVLATLVRDASPIFKRALNYCRT